MKISELEVNRQCDLTAYVSSKSENTAKNGSTYHALVLQDNTGKVDAKIWEIKTDLIDANYAAGDIVRVIGNVTTFNGSLQISVTGLELLDKDEVDISEFCPTTPQDIDKMTEELIAMVDSVENENLHTLLCKFFKNDKFMARFLKSSAAKSVHHAYVGGLLEHTLTTAKVCESLCPIYPTVNRDLLITAALCHDIGKIKELSSFPENDYTDAGQLLGHIYMGAEMIDVQARAIQGFSPRLLNELKHCILAHHGTLEYGSPVVPKLIEARMLNIADDTDAKMRRFSDSLNDLDENSWSERRDTFIGDRYRKTGEW